MSPIIIFLCGIWLLFFKKRDLWKFLMIDIAVIRKFGVIKSSKINFVTAIFYFYSALARLMNYSMLEA